MTYYLTSAFKAPLKVYDVTFTGDGTSYASVRHPDHKDKVYVPVDQLEERIELDDLL